MSKILIEKQVKERVKGEARKKKQHGASLNKEGGEVLDPQPLFHDLGFKKPETMTDKIRRITQQVQAETAAKLHAQNMSEEDVQRILDEEDDFDIPDEFDHSMTQYEAAGVVSELKEDVYFKTQPKRPRREPLEEALASSEESEANETPSQDEE